MANGTDHCPTVQPLPIFTLSQPRKALTCSPARNRPVDGYHSCYNLSGLSAGQYRYHFVPPTASPHSFSPPLNAGFNWTAEDADEEGRVWDEEDRVGKINPVYVLPWGKAEEARRWFEDKVGF